MKIILLNGNELTGYPKPVQPETIQEDNIKLDTTGQYLVLGGGKRKKAKRKKEKDSQNIETKFFSDHAFYFLKHADRIFRDSRMSVVGSYWHKWIQQSNFRCLS